MERGSPMLNTTTFVGLDVHARSIKAVALDAMTGEVRSATFGYDAAEVAGWVSSVDPSAKCVYESGVTGFDLQKRLSSMGIDCVVGAVSKMIKPAPTGGGRTTATTRSSWRACCRSATSWRYGCPTTGARRRATWCVR